MEERINLSPKTKKTGSKSANLSTMPKSEDLAMFKTMMMSPKEAKTENEEEIQNMIVYPGEVTSIDFMMPEEERKILEENLNIYENLEETQKILNKARKNKKLTEDIRDLESIKKSGELENLLYDALLDEKNIRMISKHLQNKLENGADIAKSYKELATAAKIIADARQEKMKNLMPKNNQKNTRISLKFTNDSGESFELGGEL